MDVLIPSLLLLEAMKQDLAMTRMTMSMTFL